MKRLLLTALVALASSSAPAGVRARMPAPDEAAAKAPDRKDAGPLESEAARVPEPAAAAPVEGGEAQALAPSEESAACLECHAEAEMEIGLKSGESKRLFVDQARLSASVHGALGCTACHADLKGVEAPHPKKRFKTAREFVVNYSESCQRCHFANYAKTLDSVHRAMQAKGKIEAAVCADCHGAHDVGKAAEQRTGISRTCAKCHQEISRSFLLSVHGRALSEGSKDAPACTDCHRSHDIADPKIGAFRLKTPELCGSCHTNEPMMKKYGLSTRVLQSYLADFHGTTASLQSAQEGAVPLVALCTDCHGVHDITRVKDPKSRVIQKNLVKTCRKCHADASDNFPAAWLSHYEPSFSKAPLVYGVKLLYMVLIPFMIGGLVLQVLLHLWRVVVNR